MIDVSDTIKAKSNQLNADDLIAGSITIRITKVSKESGEQPLFIYYDGDGGRPWKPCLTMRRVIVRSWGIDASRWIGRFITIYRDDSVTFGGEIKGGIRISHMSHIDQAITMSLTANRKSKKPFTVRPLTIQDPAKPDDSLIADGDAASAKGAKAYTEWLGKLTKEQKESIRSKHSAWSAKAKSVDKEKESEDIDL